MLRKSISWALTLALLLSCTVFASAESFTVNEYAGDPVLRTMDAAKLDEAKEAVIATLPEDMRDKEFTLTSGGDETGENISLISKKECAADEVQALIDSGQITEADVENLPDGSDPSVCTIESITPFVECEDGTLVNAIAARASDFTSDYTSTGWQGHDGTTGSIYIYGNLQYIRIVRSGVPEVGFRPLSVWGKYTNSSSTSISKLYIGFGSPGSVLAKYPAYFTQGGSSTVIDNAYDYVYEFTISNPIKNEIYQRSTNFASDRCLITRSNSSTEPGFTMRAYSGSRLVSEVIQPVAL